MTLVDTGRKTWNHVRSWTQDQRWKRKTLERFQDVIENNYENNENTSDYSIYDPAVLNLQRENFGGNPESQESENEEKENHLIDGEDDAVICLDWMWELLHEKITKRKISVSVFLFSLCFLKTFNSLCADKISIGFLGKSSPPVCFRSPENHHLDSP